MKKSTLISVLISSLLMLAINLVAISYTITFTANGASTILDQVVVTNLMQGTSVTVPAGSSLLLIDATSVPQLNIDESLRISPNPIITKAKVSFYTKIGGPTLINVFGMDGKKITGLVENLQTGDNEFSLTLPKGVYVLHIIDKDNTHTAKVISQNNNYAAIEFSGIIKAIDIVANKVNSASINMNYNAGDILIFKAISGNFVSILADVISVDKTVNFNMVECIDQEGNYYPVVTIGSQIWLAENLNTSRFRNNVAIADKTNDSGWGTTTNAAYSDYASPSTSRTYGKLYNGYAVTNLNNLAPVGWHIPTDTDWTLLSDFLGGLNRSGSKLKEKGVSHWMTENTDATNETGFTALPGGTRSTDGNMYDFGSIGYWWSATEGSNVNSSWYRYLQNSSGDLFRAFYNKNAGMSVRCVIGDLAILSTSGVSSITSSNASCGGEISFNGNLDIVSKGICWSTTTNPTINNDKTVDGSGTGAFNSSITGLTINNTYYVRAYATNSFGTAYGSQVSFSTKTPTLSTSAITSITDTTAVGGGSITSIGGANVTERGVCWSISPNPTITDSKSSNGFGTGTFISSISGLTRENTYYVKAYAINSIGTSYGTQVSFSTKTPELTTTAITTITATSALSGGNITSIGGSEVTTRGVCWSTSPNPTTFDSKSVDGSGSGTFTSSLTGLTHDTKYYVRAYATNSVGTSYGEELSFTTLSGKVDLTTNSPSTILLTSAISGGNIINDGGAPVTARGVCWSTSPNPTTSDNMTSNGSDIGSFTSSLTNLTRNTKYYIRAYATNSIGTSYGEEHCFTTNISTVNIPEGTYIMGSPVTEPFRKSDETQYQVTLSAFRMSVFETTNAQYADFLNAERIGNDGKYAAGAYPTQALIAGTSSWGLTYSGSQWVPEVGYENNPVINVTWYGATEFATYVGGTLPTEAQWEYACRAATTTPFNTGTCLSNIQANYDWAYPYSTCTNTYTTLPGKTQAVGTYPPNTYGLFDMHGNVWEWCSDWYGAYPTTAQANPTGAATGSRRIFRGGSWGHSTQSCRSAYRYDLNPSSYTNSGGFRVVFVP